MLQTTFSFKYVSGVQFLDPGKFIFLELNNEGLQLYETKQKVILKLNNNEIKDVVVKTEATKEFLYINTDNSEIVLESNPKGIAPTAKENIVENLQNPSLYWEKIENKKKQTEKNIKLFKDIVLYILGTVYILGIFAIFSTPLASLSGFLAGVMLIPAFSENIGKKIPFFAIKRNRIILTILLLILSFVFVPRPIKAYVTADNTIICEQPDAKTGFKRVQLMDEIKVYKKHFKENGFLMTDENNYIKTESVAFENSPELAKAKKDKELKDKKIQEEKKKQEKAREEAKKLIEKAYIEKEKELKKILDKAFDNIEISEYSFDYYVNPISWYASSLQDKKTIMNACAEYGKLKSRQYNLEGDLALLRVKILDSSNGQVLGKFSVFKGYEFE